MTESIKRTQKEKSVKVKTVMIWILIIMVLIAVGFAYFYSRGRNPLETVWNPKKVEGPPHFLYSIYEGKNRFNRPVAVSVYGNGDIYVSNNSQHTIEVVASNARPKFTIGEAGEDPGKLLFPYGTAFLANGNILVAETGNYRVQEFTSSGKFIRVFLGQPNRIGLEKPGPVAVDSKDRIYIGDLSGGQVFVLDYNGKVLRHLKGISYPHGIAVDEERNRLYVSDSGAVNIKVFALEGTEDNPIKVIDSVQPDLPFSMVRGIAVDQKGRLYVLDTISSSVRVFDHEGKYLFSFGKMGSGDGEFIYPNGIYISGTGRIYIADLSNNRVQVWGYR